MSYQHKVRKAPCSSSSSSSSNSNSSNASRTTVVLINGKKEDQVLSSTINSSAASSSTELTCDISSIEKRPAKNPDRQSKSVEKKSNKSATKEKVQTFQEEAEAANEARILMLYLCNLQKQETQRIKSEREICFSDLEAKILKAGNETSSFKPLLKVVSSSQKSEASIEELENLPEEGDIYQLQALLKTVNQTMRIANRQIPLTALKMTDASRDNFFSIIQELSNIRNEIVSIMKPSEPNQKFAAQKLETIALTVNQLRNLFDDCCSTETLIVSSAIKALSLESCLMHKPRDFQLAEN